MVVIIYLAMTYWFCTRCPLFSNSTTSCVNVGEVIPQ